MRYPGLLLTTALLLFLPACNSMDNGITRTKEYLTRQADLLKIATRGSRSNVTLANASPAASPSPEHAASREDIDAPARAKANAELLKEMYSVVFMQDPKDRSTFGNIVDSLNQGASLEGIYNGFTHSTEYRKLETGKSSASPDAVKIFSEELAQLESELPDPTHFSEKSAQPLPPPLIPDGSSAPTTHEIEFTGADESPRPFNQQEMAARYEKHFIGASIFTLKRVIGDEALKTMAAKKDFREKFATWFSRNVVRLSARNVDFGLALRNNPDEAFHYKWALSATDDRLQWEILNRLHRLLNDANRQKQ